VNHIDWKEIWRRLCKWNLVDRSVDMIFWSKVVVMTEIQRLKFWLGYWDLESVYIHWSNTNKLAFIYVCSVINLSSIYTESFYWVKNCNLHNCNLQNYETPAYETPAYNTLTYNTPTYQTSTHKAPTYQTPTHNSKSTIRFNSGNHCLLTLFSSILKLKLIPIYW